MLLNGYFSEGWTVKMNELIGRTNHLRVKLTALNIRLYRNPHLNIVTIKADQLSAEIVPKFELVADSSEIRPLWWKILVIHRVKTATFDRFYKKT
ncbi:MAG: tyrosine decarboxylase/aspartate 1-decarboxylase [Vicingaceae bacterium]|jgi:tyrosine decarboxylase/aspartate 1-decarboxylase